MSRWYDCLSLTQTQIQGLDLTGVADTSVVLLTVPTKHVKDIPSENGKVVFPFITVAPFGPERVATEENVSELITYPVLVMMVDKLPENQVTNLDRNLGWREEIIDNFVERRFTSALGNMHDTTTVQPLAPVDSGQFFNNQLFVGGLVLNFQFTVVRRQA